MKGMSVPVAQPGAGANLRLLNVHAHPDDESSKGAATTLKYVAEGARVMVATCTGGERGSVLNPKMDRPEIWENLTEVRRHEMETARAILGVEHHSLGYIDSGLPEDPTEQLPEGCFGLTDPVEAAVPLVQIIRAFRPQVMTTYDENGGYPHPDHIQCHRVSVAAFRLAADPSALPEAGPAWQVSKLYYQVGFHRARFAALDDAMDEAGLGRPYADRLAGWHNHDYEMRVTTRVPCGEYFDRSDDALRAHASQIDPDGFWFAVPTEIRRRAWPTEDYQLVYSAVPTRMPERDLFAGLRTGEKAPDPADTWII
ncbi:1D-myo-inositol 2-acetamido-2-deoxy-alpha-D-glucopyranoside deacetylase [Propionibacterium australiense]|uniref:Mycothiol S-conjugate amidase n=2 Tax=Propionibacterium australiense TaxID=119981 RepID=A0A383S8G7_9ACTN|nr:N-acetyl-1-D-myo-inositol-2-amino-2-deoxy-alpha-D-glucopyranoside deacetylase [Propionibacterium australiense]VEH89472.1 1D-myo-inositol 2-acetamido-2-deoxy-alpha-D-glucopyranoside deacetylase [Propionibacterium australiense]